MRGILLMKKIDKDYNDLIIWLIFFLVTVFIILNVQLLIIPVIFPAWHAGNGLLVGGDWVAFHQRAVEMSAMIRTDGWSAWELNPNGWVPAGIAAAFYALLWPQPWVLAPLNAAVHATSALLVIKILSAIKDDRGAAILAALPFAFFPSAMLWYTQIHRDGYSILGMLLFLYGLILIVRLYGENQKKSNIYNVMSGFVIACGGIVITWLIRPYHAVIFQYTGLLLFLPTCGYLILSATKQVMNWKEIIFKIAVFILLLLTISSLTKIGDSGKYQRLPQMVSISEITATEATKAHESPAAPRILLASAAGTLPTGNIEASEKLNIIREEDYTWKRTPWLPSVIDNQLYSIAVLRAIYFPISYGQTASGIDSNVTFHSARDFVIYLPRALQISFLAPFPRMWLGEGSLEATTFFRRISAFEMIFIYLMLVPLLYGLWLWRKKLELLIVFLFCTIMMLPIVYSTPNVGTIYRYRYGFLMLLISIGCFALLCFLRQRREAKLENLGGG